jgi:hypothetical protein
MLHTYVPHLQQETDSDLGKTYNDFYVHDTERKLHA